MTADIRARLDAMQARAEAATYVGGDMQVLADDALDLLAFARGVLDLHAREVIAVHEWGPEAWCSTCQQHWPCDAVALATRHLGGEA